MPKKRRKQNREDQSAGNRDCATLLRLPLLLWRAHQDLPRPLRFQWIVPATVLLVGFNGFVFTLRPGPLCDEGMFLFMEGGCDWGQSNVFFHSKLGLLLVLNAAFILTLRRHVPGLHSFLPHYLLAFDLSWDYRSGGSCDTYYSHPNGSIGQMVLELTAFSVLGVVIATTLSRPRPTVLILIVVACNGLHILIFYAWLPVFHHWTWAHSLAIISTLLIIAAAFRMIVRSSGQGHPQKDQEERC